MRRGSYKTDAVVLASHDFGESDRVLTFYTENFGKVSGIAKGARRSRKRFVGSLEPTVRIRLGFFASGRPGLVRVESASIIDAHNAVRRDIALYSRACCMLELTSELTREAQVSRRAYSLLSDFLALLTPPARGPLPPTLLKDADAVVRFFEIKLLTALGYMPRLSGCVVCGSVVPAMAGEMAAGGAAFAAEADAGWAGVTTIAAPAPEDAAFFCSDRGGLVCRGCSSRPSTTEVMGGRSSMVPVSRGTASLLATAIRFEPVKLARLKPGDTFLRESDLVLDSFIKHIIGREMRTRVFIEKLSKASF